VVAARPLIRPPITVFDHGIWKRRFTELSSQFIAAEPFPHIVIDNLFPDSFLHSIRADLEVFKSDNWINYSHINERKRGFNRFDELPDSVQHIISELNTPEFCEMLSRLTGILGLVSDDSLEGGGVHETRQGGYLNIHADFVSHPHRANWRRRLNVILFLNPTWEKDWNGQLEFWSRDMERCVTKIDPIFNRCVIFETDDSSYHGHPDPLVCPPDVVRRSIALYYFTPEEQDIELQSTHYRARPQDASKRWLIEVDNLLLKGYTLAKRRLDLKDNFLSKLLSIGSR
jgi:Rps23 Pro-64 3,4-dihydroxylase Tpa1-like proline 4-hydroxylase